MMPENCHFEFDRCTGLKASGMYYDVTENQSETETCIEKGSRKMSNAFVEFS